MLDDLSIDAVLGKIEAWANIGAFTKPPDADYFVDAAVSDAYRAATARRDWPTVDRLVLDLLAQNRSVYDKFLDAEEWMHAFSDRLCAEADTAHAAFRWLDPPELQSCLGGTFESKLEDDHTRRGFKALSLNPNLKFLSRKVMMAVPLSHGMRRHVKCVSYTALPRQVKAMDERISDEKNAANAKEAEIRVPDGTQIPAGTTFAVQQDATVDKRVIAMLRERYAVKR